MKEWEKFKKLWIRSELLRQVTFLVVLLVVLTLMTVRFKSPEKESHAETIPLEKLSCDVPSKPPQFVVFSFDGSKSKEMWEETRSFARDMRSRGKPLSFTYFVSAVYLLTPEHKDLYISPRGLSGDSAIGFGDSDKDVLDRVEEINTAITEGHEIASHAGGHFAGTYWSEAEWLSDLNAFDSLLFNVGQNNGWPDVHVNLSEKDILGFRAPELAQNANLFKALKSKGYRYDASLIALGKDWPKKDQNGIWLYPLGTISLEPGRHWTISMDYSIYQVQSGAHDTLVRGTPSFESAKTEVLDAYMTYFNRSYNGNRAPISIGHHFSKWNQGLYLDVLKATAEEICGLPDVRCVTYRELTNFLDKLPPEMIAYYDRGGFK